MMQGLVLHYNRFPDLLKLLLKNGMQLREKCNSHKKQLLLFFYYNWNDWLGSTFLVFMRLYMLFL